MDPNIQDTTQEKEKRKRRFLLLLIALLLIAVAVMAVFLIRGNGKSAPVEESGGVGLTVDKNAGEYVPVEVELPEELPGIAIPGWGSITLPAGETDIVNRVDFYNPEDNADWYYLTFELRLLDDSEQGYEVLYASELVPPGQHIQSITLSRPLEAGEYDAVVHVQPYRMNDELTPTNNADMATTLVVG